MIGKKFIAPALPVPPLEYNQREQTDLIRSLRLYFNLLDNYFQTTILDALNGGVGGNGITLPHIAASDSTDQVATGNNTATAVNFNTLDSGYLWTLNAPGSATADVAGVYTIRYSLQFINTANAIHYATVWLKVNNVDIPNSSTVFSITARKSASPGEEGYVVGYSEITFEVDVGDEIELYWATDLAGNPTTPTDGVYLYHDVAQTTPYARPAIPSVIGSITYVSALT
jgi:hypothetical protein